MAEEAKPSDDDDARKGAPVPKGFTDEELVNLKIGRARTKIGVVTAAGVTFLCALFLVKLNPDRRFAWNDDSPKSVAVADVVAGKVDGESFVSLEAEPMMSHAARIAKSTTSVGLRAVPIRNTGDKLWLVLDGDGWAAPTKGPYVGRLRRISDLPFADVLGDFVAAHPRPVFASPAAVRAGFASGKVATVGGDQLTLRDSDRVAFDIVDPNAAVIVAAFNENHKDTAAWTKALAGAGITTTGTPNEGREQVRFDVAMPAAVATAASKLEAANLWAARVDPVTRHYDTTWGVIKTSGPAGFTAPNATIPDSQLDLVGVYVGHGIPSGAYALILGDQPQDYWYVLPVAIVVLLLGIAFAWALVRAVKRDLLTRTA